MTHSLLWLLLVMSCVSLAGLAISGVLVSRAQKYRQKRDARLSSVVTPHIRVQRLEISAFTPAPKPRDQSLIGTAGWLFGFEPAAPDRYPMVWWIVVLVMLAVAFAARSVVADFFNPFVAWLAVPAAWISLSRAFFGFFDRRRREQLLAQFPDALAMIVRAVRVGIPVQESMRNVSRELPHPTGPAFTRLVNDVAVGVPLDEAINDMAQRSGLPEYRFFATALSLQNQTGGALSETLDGLADVIRKRAALRAKGIAMTSESKATAAILAALPVIIGVMLWMLNPAYIALLFNNDTGRNMFAAAVISLSIGLFAIRTIIKRSLPT